MPTKTSSTKRKDTTKQVVTLTYEEASRKNIPTAEYQPVMDREQMSPIRVAYERRNRDLDPQLVWRGKDEQDWSDLVAPAPPLYIQEKIHPKVLIDDLIRRSQPEAAPTGEQIDLFSDFNGLPSESARTEFYQHDANWSNRMILGDSLQVMASLAEREGLRGQVQCIYIDPPYGIKFNSNFQWSTKSRDVKDGNPEHITREPEQVKAFRDTWRDGIHSYLTYLRDRLTIARDLLADSGSLFVQIGDENVHRIKSLIDEVMGEENFIANIVCLKTSGQASKYLPGICDYVLMYGKNADLTKYRALFRRKSLGERGTTQYVWLRENGNSDRRITTRDDAIDPTRVFAADNLGGQGATPEPTPFEFQGTVFYPGSANHWKPSYPTGLTRLAKADRLKPIGRSLMYRRYLLDFEVSPINNIWDDVLATGLTEQKLYVVQSSQTLVERCILMSTDPGDLVLDPTCGSGTTAYVAEQWGRRWITIDTSRVALALARARIMGARYPYYLLADSREGQLKEAEIKRVPPSEAPTYGDIRHGFVYERVPHITLKSIANNAEIDVIWEKFQQTLEPLRQQLNAALKKNWEEWEIPREGDESWPSQAKGLHRQWWEQRIARHKEIDASIAAKAEYEYLYDKPYEDKSKVRVAGPFTVESISPHRTLAVGENDELIDPQAKTPEAKTFAEIILENLKTSGVQQAHKQDKISFASLTPWPGTFVCAEGTYTEADSGKGKRAAIFIGPEFGSVSRPDLVEAVREAADAGFDVLISCAFNYDAHSSEFNKLGRVPVLKARMNADLHMAGDLKNTGKGNLFVIFGEPDIDILDAESGQIQVKVKGVDVFDPSTGEIRSDTADGIACWFIDTDYNEESFFVRHAYFLGANDPYKALKTTLKAEINEDAWASLRSDTSRPFPKPKSGRIAVKVINHLGDEVMKVFRVRA
jgi:adenine-specific DNA-methyltransferase